MRVNAATSIRRALGLSAVAGLLGVAACTTTSEGPVSGPQATSQPPAQTAQQPPAQPSQQSAEAAPPTLNVPPAATQPAQPPLAEEHNGPVPYNALQGQPGAGTVGLSAYAGSSGLSGSDLQALASAITYARRGQVSYAQQAETQISDPVARKVVLWATIDADGEALPFYQLNQAKQSLAGWPRVTRREQVTEKALGASGMAPQQVVAWFAGAQPTTPQGAMALATAEQELGRGQDAAALIRHWWRTQIFDADVQRSMFTRFSAYLTTDDHVARVDTLLYGSQGPALHDLLYLLPPDQLALAKARMALRERSYDAMTLVSEVPPALASSPGLALEQARYLHERDQDAEALALVPRLPQTMPCNEAADKNWLLRKQLINVALKQGDYRSAYTLAAGSGLTSGADYAEAEFYAGWLALSKLHQPQLADTHFANIQQASSTPITQARALYWRGRAADAEGDHVQAMTFYAAGGRYITTFYGQLAASKAGVTQISIGRDPAPTPDQRAAFSANEVVRAVRMLGALDDRELFRSFVLAAADDFTQPCDDAMLVDLVLGYGDQDLAMRVVRVAAQHDVILPERGYPVRSTASLGAEPAMVFSLTRQESNFDPHARSNVGARGLMQLMPATAERLARRLGQTYYPAMLDDPDYNMRLGAYYISSMIDNFGGSYVMATAAYNAGPGRPAEWASYCGDPRAGSVDPLDFIECIPFSETRNYVMRVMESAEVYRARLNGGSGPNRLEADLKRGGYAYGGLHSEAAAAASTSLSIQPAAATAPPQ